FDPRPEQSMPWPRLRERLRAKLGDEAVYRVDVAPDPRPDRGQKRVRDDAAGASAGPVHPRGCVLVPVPARRVPEDSGAIPARPAWLLERPVPLRDPRLRILRGPERLESGWWDGGDARRDYYVLETSQGQRAWAFAPPGEQG